MATAPSQCIRQRPFIWLPVVGHSSHRGAGAEKRRARHGSVLAVVCSSSSGWVLVVCMLLGMPRDAAASVVGGGGGAPPSPVAVAPPPPPTTTPAPPAGFVPDSGLTTLSDCGADSLSIIRARACAHLALVWSAYRASRLATCAPLSPPSAEAHNCGALTHVCMDREQCKVTHIITLPMGLANFTASKQDAFKTSLAAMAGVTAADVSIDSILPSHGVGTPIIRVHTGIIVADMSAAGKITQSIDNWAFPSSLFDGLQVSSGVCFPLPIVLLQ